MVKEKVRSTIFCKLAALGRQLTAAPSPADPNQSLTGHFGQHGAQLLLRQGEVGIPGGFQNFFPADGLVKLRGLIQLLQHEAENGRLQRGSCGRLYRSGSHGPGGLRKGEGLLKRGGQIVKGDLAAAGIDQILHHIAQLTDVARPGIAAEKLLHLGREDKIPVKFLSEVGD